MEGVREASMGGLPEECMSKTEGACSEGDRP